MAGVTAPCGKGGHTETISRMFTSWWAWKDAPSEPLALPLLGHGRLGARPWQSDAGRRADTRRCWPAPGLLSGEGPGRTWRSLASRHVPQGRFPYDLSWSGPLHP